MAAAAAVVKTPISYLQEICVKYEFTLPKYDLIVNGHEKVFEYSVTASNYTANGASSSKQLAKHTAAKELLDKLKRLDRFKDILREIPSIPQPEKNNNIVDPVTNLLEICQKHNWDMPAFTLVSFTGPSNNPIFTIACTLKGFRTEGCARSKKDAKKVAAKQMFEQIEHLIEPESDSPPAEEHIPNLTIDELLALYRKHHKWNRTNATDLLGDRHYYFEKFDDDKKNAAKKILHMNDSPREIVHAFCKVLNMKYIVSNVPRSPNKAFELLVEGFDCVIVDKEADIWDQVVDYFKIMMWACWWLISGVRSISPDQSHREPILCFESYNAWGVGHGIHFYSIFYHFFYTREFLDLIVESFTT